MSFDKELLQRLGICFDLAEILSIFFEVFLGMR